MPIHTDGEVWEQLLFHLQGRVINLEKINRVYFSNKLNRIHVTFRKFLGTERGTIW